MVPLTARQLAGMIDHTLLKPDTTTAQIHQLCQEALEYNFASVCINPVYVAVAHELLKKSAVKTCCVIGFPLGASRSADKTAEAAGVIADGAQEVDMVLQIGALKEQNDTRVVNDIAGVATVCHANGALLKVILETGLLTQEEKQRACRLCIQAGADFVKTSTGFGFGGATVEDVQLMSAAVSPAGLGVKASGGIRTRADACTMINAGATRIGTSAGVAMMTIS